MWGSAEVARTNSKAMFSNGLSYMSVSVLIDQQGLHQLCADTGYHLRDLPRVMVEWDYNERDRERQRERQGSYTQDEQIMKMMLARWFNLS